MNDDKVHVKKCPNCGSVGRKLRVFAWDAETHYVECLDVDCRMSGPLGGDHDEAVDKWNQLPRWGKK